MDIYYLSMDVLHTIANQSIDQFFSFFVAERERIFEHTRAEAEAEHQWC